MIRISWKRNETDNKGEHFEMVLQVWYIILHTVSFVSLQDKGEYPSINVTGTRVSKKHW